jgi:hypothetical protein
MEMKIKETEIIGQFIITVSGVTNPHEHTDAKNKIALKLLELSATKLQKKSFIQVLEEYVKAVQDYSDEDTQNNLPKLWEIGQQHKYGYEMGKRWAKVITTQPQRSVFCFVDPANGDIYKPAGWNAPAKGKRGNIYDEKRPLTGGSLYNRR